MQKRTKFILIVICLALLAVFFLYMNYSSQKAITANQNEVQENLDNLTENDLLPKENSVYIPKLDILSGVSEGEYESDRSYLKTWRRTHTNTPDQGGNTVIVGHRYRNKDEYPLFDIDQIVSGDTVTVFWDGEQYDYTVTETFEVGLGEIWVEDPTDDDILTLYACDWSGNNRLVVRAELQF